MSRALPAAPAGRTAVSACSGGPRPCWMIFAEFARGCERLALCLATADRHRSRRFFWPEWIRAGMVPALEGASERAGSETELAQCCAAPNSMRRTPPADGGREGPCRRDRASGTRRDQLGRGGMQASVGVLGSPAEVGADLRPPDRITPGQSGLPTVDHRCQMQSASSCRSELPPRQVNGPRGLALRSARRLAMAPPFGRMQLCL